MRWNTSNFRNTIKHFLKQFMTHYVLALQERYLYQRRRSINICILKVNNIVLVKDDSVPRLSCQKGKVGKLICGDDNLVHRADVCVYQDNLGKTIVIHRPLQLLVQLEVTDILHNHNGVNEPVNERPITLALLSADLMHQLSTWVNPNS